MWIAWLISSPKATLGLFPVASVMIPPTEDIAMNALQMMFAPRVRIIIASSIFQVMISLFAAFPGARSATRLAAVHALLATLSTMVIAAVMNA